MENVNRKLSWNSNLCEIFSSLGFVLQSSILLDDKNREAFMEDIDDEYEDIREDHYDNLRDRRYVSIEKARENRFKIDWSNYCSSKFCMKKMNRYFSDILRRWNGFFL